LCSPLLPYTTRFRSRRRSSSHVRKGGRGMSTPVVYDATGFALPDSQRAVIRWTIFLGFAALAVGVINGLGQALNYAGVDILRFLDRKSTRLNSSHEW